ncbi:MAG TPA: DUF4249 domain-containing protein [Flavobacteriales bacterium]|nr:DUF4249 domain-containing protein [Flavobacteriales bacterium]HRE98210.1 DUF4249 domain-containing protein [Flavobacteriales bacterium]HRJ36740.1 DUF4249 domain-containing protein [Flavobacteriales bacterium]HRJ38000.1 DUF4249 domain-containing protein [Flavobacteriales bacterium]
MAPKKTILFLFPLILLVLVACERDVDIEIPGGTRQPAVYGWIEPGAPPIIIFTRAQPYFGSSNFSSFEELFIHNASITVSTDNYSALLFELCSNSIPDSLLPVVGQFLGLDSITLASVNYCVYTSFDANIFGVVGKNYYLNIATTEGEQLSAVTKIPQPVALDSLWFQPERGDTLGFIWARLTDPDTLGNAYRWFAQRQGKDNGFIAPYGSSFDDKFINGTSFNFGVPRGDNDFAPTPEVEGERGYFKVGDTVIAKFCTIDMAHFQFWRSFDTQLASNGNPFAAPAPLRSNITGGLGIWGGYSPSYDTLIITP